MKKVERHDDARLTSPSALLIALLMYAPTNQNKPLAAGLPVNSQCSYILPTNELQDSTQIRNRNIKFTISVEFSKNFHPFLAIQQVIVDKEINNVQTLFAQVWRCTLFCNTLDKFFGQKNPPPVFWSTPNLRVNVIGSFWDFTALVNVQEGKGEFIQKLLFGDPKTQVIGENTPI